MLSVLIYILFIVYTLLYFLIFSVVFVLTVPFDKTRRVLHWFSWLWTKGYFVLVPGWKLVREGLENVDKTKPWVVAVNHRSMYDIILMYAVPLNFKWVSKKEVYKWPVFGWVLWMHGDIAIERGAASSVKKMVRDSKTWLDRGVSIMIFPEGSRSKEPRVGKFREGAFMIARNAGVGILPVVAEGTGTATRGWRLNLRNRFAIKVLPPVSAEEVRATPTKELTARLNRQMAAEYEDLKTRMGNYG